MIEPTNRMTTALVDFIADHTPHCREITRLLSRSMEGKLSLRTRLLIRLHFTICVWCERYAGQMKNLRLYSRKFPDEGCPHCQAALSREARQRLNKALQSETRSP